MEKSCPGKKGSPFQLNQPLWVFIWEKSVTFPQAKSLKKRSSTHWLSLFDWVDPAGWAKEFLSQKVGAAKRVTLQSQKGKPAR